MSLDGRLGRLARRIGLREALRVTSSAAPWLLLALVLLVAADRLGLGAIALLPAAAGGVVVLLAAASAGFLLGRPELRRVALMVDLRLGTREVVSAGREAGPDNDHPLWLRARRDAMRLLRDPRVRRAFPLTEARAWRATLLGVVALALAPWIPLPRFGAPGAAAPSPAVVATGEELAREIRELRGALQEDRPEAMELMQRLEERAEAMRRAELADAEEALLALERMEREVEAFARRAEERAMATGLQDLLERLGEDPFTQELASAMDEGDREAIRQALERMAGALPADQAEARTRQDQLERLADRLAEMSSLLKGIGERELAAKLRQAAEALREGDLAEARELLSSVEVAKAASECSGGSELARDLLNLMAEARWMLGAGEIPKLGSGAESTGGNRLGAGAMPGVGSTNEQGPGYSTGDPLVRDRLGDETTDTRGDFEALYDSRLVEAGSWEDIQGSGRIGESGEVLSETGRGLGIPGDATVPLRPLAAPAEGVPEAAGDLERVPPGYRDIVRRYFERNERP